MNPNRFIQEWFDGRFIPRKTAKNLNDFAETTQAPHADIDGCTVVNFSHRHFNTIQYIVDVYKIAPLIATAPYFEGVFFPCSPCSKDRKSVV